MAVPVPSAHAVLLSFSFSGIAGANSSLSLLDAGGQPVDISGLPFTVTGHTENDIDVYNGPGAAETGVFAATAIYDFGSFGSFETNRGGDFYGQNCGTTATIFCVFLSTADTNQGFRISFTPAIAGDPNSGIAIGTQAAVSFEIQTRTQTNVRGDTLTIGTGGNSLISSVTANAIAAEAIPEPASIALLGISLLGLSLARRRKVL